MNRLPIQMNNVNLACDSIFFIHKRQPEVNQAVTYPKSLRFAFRKFSTEVVIL